MFLLQMSIITHKTLLDQQHYANGYILLISVVIVGAIATSIAVALLFLGSADSKNAISHLNSDKAKASANACAEEALEQLRSNTGFVGANVVALNGGNCSYTVVNTGVNSRSVTVSSTVDGIVRRVGISVTALNPKITAVWQEVP
jgi:hypothetical protein